MRPACRMARSRCARDSGGTSMARTLQAHRISNVGRMSCRITCHSASASRIVTVSAGSSAAAQAGSIARMPSTTNNHRVMSSPPVK